MLASSTNPRNLLPSTHQRRAYRRAASGGRPATRGTDSSNAAPSPQYLAPLALCPVRRCRVADQILRIRFDRVKIDTQPHQRDLMMIRRMRAHR